MALLQLALRGLVPAASKAGAIGVGLRQMSTAGSGPSKGEVVHFLDGREDPEVDDAIRAYQRAAFAAGKRAPEAAEEVPELTALVQKKYVAAQIVEVGIQNISVPLSSSDSAAVKRYVQQLSSLGAKAGFEHPMSEVTKRVRDTAAGAVTAKELVAGLKSVTTPDFHAALVEAVSAAEAATNAPVTLDGSSAGYKKFAEHVKKAAEAHKLPVKLLDSKGPLLDEAAAQFAQWAQAAQVADAAAELDAIRAEATAVLDKHLAKSADQIRKEQASALAALQKKIDSAKGAAWAAQWSRDLKALNEYDAAVAKGV